MVRELNAREGRSPKQPTSPTSPLSPRSIISQNGVGDAQDMTRSRQRSEEFSCSLLRKDSDEFTHKFLRSYAHVRIEGQRFSERMKFDIYKRSNVHKHLEVAQRELQRKRTRSLSRDEQAALFTRLHVDSKLRSANRSLQFVAKGHR